MNTNYKLKTKTSTENQRSFFDWGCNMQVLRKGNGEIAMTASELVRFFGVTWRKLNHRLQTIIKTSDLHPDERVAGEEEVIISGQLKGYAPLYPLPVIIVLSFLLDSTEAHLFRKYLCERLQKPASVINLIFLFGNTNN
ncbi:hypothetical protein [Prevotella histicola]|uniref:hypothetical protein n=1 Tax=Prevotella histicola TaxID=470565 RepID=UPI002150AA92|nr:hypothetical protein [Prevotella histicola]